MDRGSSRRGSRPRLGCAVVMVDISPRMVELARARGVDAHVGDAAQLPFADGSFDCVVAAWMLFHLPDIDRGLAELSRVLGAGRQAGRSHERERHMEELRAVAGKASWERTFTRENGAEFLEAALRGRRAPRRRRVGDDRGRRARLRVRGLTRRGRAAHDRGRTSCRWCDARRSSSGVRRDSQIVMRPAELIEQKRNGEEHDAAELAELVLAYARDEVPDYQMAAWCMAVYFKGLTGARDACADRRDDPLRRDARPRCRTRTEGRRQALDGRGGRQDLDRGRADRRRVRRPAREDVRARARAHGRDARQARVDPGLPRSS